MPNYKVFQDYADSMRVKIYGVDDSNNTVPLLTNASGKMNVTGTVATSGSVAVSGPVEISGSVAVSGPVGISGSVAVSGTVGVFLSGRGTLDSGPLFDRTSGSDSGALSGVWDVLGFNGWTLAVKYSGTSGDQVSVKLQMAAISGANNWVDDGGYVAFSGTNAYWIFRTPTYHVRYARLYAKNESATASGDFLVYMQGEY